ncbi:MAG TPA: Vms1/Ankzf1 family peptidyl-tRNA hydrolase [Planctomycetota bacterium]|nr:Vms1/Ankzf1 family peptidyl-tRNA hydrolase [Planctomycetota bacterium]
MSGYDDLKALVDAADWFFTVALPAPSQSEDSAHRFEVEWANARRDLSDGWDADELATVDALMETLPHDGGEAVLLVHPRGGSTLVEFLDEPVRHRVVHEGPCPRLAPLIEARQRALPHVMVQTDRAGADLAAFDGGTVLATESVDGDTVHIHRGHAGGWSQRRFQQRAENTWERNGNDVADAVASLARTVDAQLVAVAGDVRAQGFVLDALPPDIAERAVKIDAGSPEGIADEVVRLLSDRVASDIVSLAEQVRTELANDRASVESDATLHALVEGRVDTLLAHDDGSTGPTVRSGQGFPDGARTVDAAIAAALRTDAQVVIVPALAVLDGPIAALLRW